MTRGLPASISDLPVSASIRAISQAAGTVNGVGVDAQYALEVLWIVDVGAATGAPTSLTVDVKVQDSDDNATFADAKDEANASIAIAQLTAGSAVVKLPDKLHANAGPAGARPSKRYRRAVATVAFVGGASPAVPVAVHAQVVKRLM